MASNCASVGVLGLDFEYIRISLNYCQLHRPILAVVAGLLRLGVEGSGKANGALQLPLEVTGMAGVAWSMGRDN